MDPPGERPSFEDCVARTAAHYLAWLDRQPPVPPDLEDARALAAYITWSCILGPRGGLARPSLFSSKNWMYSCWSWDQPFSAQALAPGLPDLAWDQVMTHFDLQHPDGGLPDLINDNGHLFGFAKPPNHGWGLRHLATAGVVTDARLAELYPKLARATEWWLRCRDDDGDGLCEYFHGNDSGWDNATAFDMGFPVEGPDLASFLVIQMDVLADAAERLGHPEDAATWRARADRMLDLMLERLWDGERFRVLRAGDHVTNPASRSLIAYLPMILGDRLPADVRERLVRSFRESDHLTEFGPATESPSSPLFARDGYWRGPVWGPTSLLIADGLDACGERDPRRGGGAPVRRDLPALGLRRELRCARWPAAPRPDPHLDGERLPRAGEPLPCAGEPTRRSPVTGRLDLDLASVPWSRRGSYMTLTTLERVLGPPGPRDGGPAWPLPARCLGQPALPVERRVPSRGPRRRDRGAARGALRGPVPPRACRARGWDRGRLGRP